MDMRIGSKATPPSVRVKPGESGDAVIDRTWDDSVVPTLMDYVRIPNKSADFDKQWAEHGYMDQAVALVQKWAEGQGVKGLKFDVVRLPGRGPLIMMEVPGQTDDTVLMYGHLDKQPEMTGWTEGREPWKPVLSNNRLYGRGAADDGYAAFAALTAIKALQAESRPHARAVILIETGEESGSPDLPAYVDHLKDRIGDPSLIVCLDSGCGDYDHLWGTTSLRGLVGGTLKVEMLKEGIHSGEGGGMVASPFRIMRQLLSRVEDEKTGDILIPECNVKIPQEPRQQAKSVASLLNKGLVDALPLIEGGRPENDDPQQLILNRTWRPALAYTGVDGLPSLADAGNVLRHMMALQLSMRLPPTCDAEAAEKALKATLEKDPPYGAKVTWQGTADPGWCAPPMETWLEHALDKASQSHFGNGALYTGEGGSIPFMGMLGQRFPRAQFLITGVLGPGSNAHGPNEFLDIPTGKRITACIADVLEAHVHRGGSVAQ
ncbi:MAG: M20/M25/M40 family metallo-hydrolase [Candidatus Xenobia bacterium]